MNNIFFFIKRLLGQHSTYLIYFIVFNLFPKSDLYQFRHSICESIFINENLKDILKLIFFRAAFYRYKLKRMIHYYRWKKAKSANITEDLYQTPLSVFPQNQKIVIIQHFIKFDFRLSDLLTMWVKALKHSDGLFPQPIYLKNPYTSNIFKIHNLYNIYFALFNSSFHIHPLINYLFLFSFDLKKFKLIKYPCLQEIAIHNYYTDISDEEKFEDLISMLNTYGKRESPFYDQYSPYKKKYMLKKMDSFLLYYYSIEYTHNPLLKERNIAILKKKIPEIVLQENL